MRRDELLGFRAESQVREDDVAAFAQQGAREAEIDAWQKRVSMLDRGLFEGIESLMVGGVGQAVCYRYHTYLSRRR